MKRSEATHRLFAEPRMLIDGEWQAGADPVGIAHRDPTTGAVLGKFPAATPGEIDAAIEAARRAFPAWRDCAPARRRDILTRAAGLFVQRAEEFATIAALETGAVFSIAAGQRWAEYLTYYGGWIDKLEGLTTPLGPGAFNFVTHEPYGVVVALTSWNGPVTSAMMKLAPALAAGNCIVLKPPELGPFATMLLGEVFQEAGLPAGVLNIITGGAAVGAALVSDPRVGKISFTGGLPTARHVLRAAAEFATPVVTELGGKSANIVMPDADLDRAAAMAATVGCMTHAGQGCLFPTRLLVADEVYDEVVGRVLSHVARARVGDPFEPGMTSGPLINAAALDRVLGVVDAARERGDGTLLAGGHRLGGELASGYFIAPTVFGDVDNASPLAQDEIFGPVLSIIRVADEADAIAKANNSKYGLAGYVHTRDITRAHRIAAALEVGYVGINGFPPLPVQAPFGGAKQSGSGREHGRVGMEEYLRLKNVYLSLP